MAEEQTAPPWPNGSVDFDAVCALARKGELNAESLKTCVHAEPEAKASVVEPEAEAPASKKKEA